MTPYYSDDSVQLFHGRAEDVLPPLGVVADVCVTDPPYGETSLAWDRWPKGWPTLVAAVLPPVTSLWCFGSMRMFLERRDEFVEWAFSQDVVWEKQNGSGAVTDRFRRVHEHALLFYRGAWGSNYKNVQRVDWHGPRRFARRPKDSVQSVHRAPINEATYEWIDDGTRTAPSVIRANSMHKKAQHPTEKPTGILDPLIAYSCPPGGTVLDPFAGSGSTLDAARCTGRKAVGVEAHEPYCEVIARRLSQGDLFGGAA